MKEETMKDEAGEIPHWDVNRNTREWLKDHIEEYRCRFEPKPIVNHMSQWPVWADKFLDSEDAEKQALAHMLMYSLKDKEDFLIKWRVESAKYNALFFSFIETVERLPLWARWAVVTPRIDDTETNPLKKLKTLARWRAENKYNIREWDE
jgi:hypothetical protein